MYSYTYDLIPLKPFWQVHMEKIAEMNDDELIKYIEDMCRKFEVSNLPNKLILKREIDMHISELMDRKLQQQMKNIDESDKKCMDIINQI